MAALVTQSLVNAGTAPTLTGAAAVSDTAQVGNGSNTFAVYTNTDSVDHVVKITVPGNTAYGQALPDPTYTVAATTGTAWIPLRSEYIDKDVAGIGRCTISVFAADGTTPGATGVKVAIVKVG